MTTAGELGRAITHLHPWEPACIDDPHLWTSDNAADQSKAIAQCAGCAVQTMCRQAGADEPYVWGGTIPTQRNRSPRRLDGQAEPCRNCGHWFIPRASNQKYCTRACNDAVHRSQQAASNRRRRVERP